MTAADIAKLHDELARCYQSDPIIRALLDALVRLIEHERSRRMSELSECNTRH